VEPFQHVGFNLARGVEQLPSSFWRRGRLQPLDADLVHSDAEPARSGRSYGIGSRS